MANGDITKEIEYDKIEVVSQWNIQVRKATVNVPSTAVRFCAEGCVAVAVGFM